MSTHDYPDAQPYSHVPKVHYRRGRHIGGLHPANGNVRGAPRFACRAYPGSCASRTTTHWSRRAFPRFWAHGGMDDRERRGLRLELAQSGLPKLSGQSPRRRGLPSVSGVNEIARLKQLTSLSAVCLGRSMTQRSIHPAGIMTAPPPAPASPVARGSAALTTGLLILVTLLITVLTGAGFGYV